LGGKERGGEGERQGFDSVSFFFWVKRTTGREEVLSSVRIVLLTDKSLFSMISSQSPTSKPLVGERSSSLGHDEQLAQDHG